MLKYTKTTITTPKTNITTKKLHTNNMSPTVSVGRFASAPQTNRSLEQRRRAERNETDSHCHNPIQNIIGGVTGKTKLATVTQKKYGA
jgi:hypothetical protein